MLKNWETDSQPNPIKVFLRSFVFGLGIIWLFLTIGLVIFNFSLGMKEIVFTWIIAGLFAGIMTKLELDKQQAD